ncbi:hypothetical protein LTR36_001498 [Oleoguttula mirabilis]|uniref:Uncharacterized protein n=1 Tax=Oleoguttula mirabilis TaxID=1507867 RepID=A0AAV9JP11_9PEZI|nr:hypothetical protein LTR36_001498 [Oleoguttula mirabilis]
MAPLIPPLDFSRSPDSFTTAVESLSLAQADSDNSLRSSQTISHSPLPVTMVESQQEVSAPLKRSATVSSQQRNKLVERSATVGSQQVVKHTQLVKTSAVEQAGTKYDDGAESYRCDIHNTANGAAFRTADSACKHAVLDAGGTIIDDFAYIGGFLYQMPPHTPNPLRSGSNATESGGGHIDITPWTHFPRAMFNGLKLTPYGGAGEFLILPVPPHRSAPLPLPLPLPRLMGKTWPGSCDDMTKRRISLWLREMARNYGSSVRYLA